MSKVKPNKKESTPNAKISQATNGKEKQKSGKKKKKRFFKQTEKKDIVKDGHKSKTALPPKDAKEFSANWKSLLEVLKSSPDVKNAQTNHLNKTNREKEEHQKKIHKENPKLTRATQPSPGKLIKNGDSTFSNQGNKKETKAGKRKATESHTGKEKTRNSKKTRVEVEKKTAEADLWFDDVDPDDLEAAVGPEAADIFRRKHGLQKSDPQTTERALVKEHAYEGLTRAVAMDCEMVGVGPSGEDSIVARVSIVNQFGKCIYDKFVKPTEKVTDYRTAISGIRPEDIRDGEDVKVVQKEVAEILQGRILVGHAIHNDLKVLLLNHPKKKIRDTQKYKPFKTLVKSSRPALKELCKQMLNVDVQRGEHSSVQDAQATMRLYTLVKKRWEAELKASREQKADKAANSQMQPK
ncbi:RNA exonuclease 4 [Chanos chanos]|uniref:RNA exonuclease 4 n=1 Tax=Chanos chanos TaxID=29144 RepID=A0A6J2UYL5_CHACN|nr:RNA exonuclease 4 [Chanos chanos]